MKRLLSLLTAPLLVCSMAASASADSVSGDLFFTTFSGGQNINKVHFSYDGVSTFSLGSIVNIASTPGADGLTFAPDGDLLVGGQGNIVHKVNISSGTFTSKNAGGTSAFHIMMDPNGTQAWSAGIPGTPATIPLSPFSNGTAHPLNGDDLTIDTIAWDGGGKAYYTRSGSGGNGNFGTIDLSTFTTTRTMTGVAAAHGMAFDSFTGNLILFGDSHISQIDPTNLTALKSDKSFVGLGFNFDQGTVDGKGHIFAADNNGKLLFMDYFTSGLVGNAGNFVASPFLASFLDDVAPLSGPGAPPVSTASTVPEPATLVLLGLGLAACVGMRKKFSSKNQ